MHDTSNKYLLQIHPKELCSKDQINDDLTVKMEILLKNARKGTQYRGFHTCTGCGKIGGSCDLIVGQYITNSLAVHYLQWHRNDVPLSEIKKLKRLDS